MYSIEYMLYCEALHALFALLWASPVAAWTSIIYYRGCRDRRTYWSLLLLGLALGCTSHYLADVWQLGF
jgi:hypothetical protein